MITIKNRDSTIRGERIEILNDTIALFEHLEELVPEILIACITAYGDDLLDLESKCNPIILAMLTETTKIIKEGIESDEE